MDEYPFAFNRKNALELIGAYDLVIDATDNFQTKYLINDATAILAKPMIFGAVTRYEGQLSVFNVGFQDLPANNYRQLFPIQPKEGETGSCEQMGVLGVLPGIIGTMQAAEAIKLITGIGEPLVGRLYNYHLLQGKGYELCIQTKQTMPAMSISEFMALVDEVDFNCENGIDAGNDIEKVDEMEDVEEINVAKFQTLRKHPDVFVLDVRESHEYPSINFSDLQIPMSELMSKITALPDKEICVICHQGIRSVYAAQQIQLQRGLKVYSLKGGLTAYFNQEPS